MSAGGHTVGHTPWDTPWEAHPPSHSPSGTAADQRTLHPGRRGLNPRREVRCSPAVAASTLHGYVQTFGTPC